MYSAPSDPLDVKAYSDDISFVDRDMIIRHVPELGVGHVYGPSVATGTHSVADGTLAPEDIPEDIDVVMALESQAIDEDETHHEGDSLEVDDPELGLDNRETDILDEEDFSGEERIEEDLQLQPFGVNMALNKKI